MDVLIGPCTDEGDDGASRSVRPRAASTFGDGEQWLADILCAVAEGIWHGWARCAKRVDFEGCPLFQGDAHRLRLAAHVTLAEPFDWLLLGSAFQCDRDRAIGHGGWQAADARVAFAQNVEKL